ncbi:MAG: hypothetical protein KGD67_12525, partial [Candidatus Lokiarchaeota archaeon]|nr:hypothetical protein [Candidatus Lokiarchaeota archaeon]
NELINSFSEIMSTKVLNEFISNALFLNISEKIALSSLYLINLSKTLIKCVFNSMNSKSK